MRSAIGGMLCCLLLWLVPASAVTAVSASPWVLVTQPVQAYSALLQQEIHALKKENNQYKQYAIELTAQNDLMKQRLTTLYTIEPPSLFQALPASHHHDFRLWMALSLGLLLWWTVLSTMRDSRQEKNAEEEEYDFLSSEEGVPAKLDLIEAYLTMGDKRSASSVISEVLVLGNSDQRAQAKALLARMDSA